jgi:hypothetical protein
MTETLLKGLRVNAGDDPSKGIIGGQSVRQFEVARKPVSFSVCEVFNVLPPVSAADSGADGDEEDVVEFVKFKAIPSRVIEVLEVIKERRHGRRGRLSGEEPNQSTNMHL